MQTSRLYAFLVQSFTRLTQPADTITDPAVRRRARMIAALSLIPACLFTVYLFILIALLRLDLIEITPDYFIAQVYSTIVLFAIGFVVRRYPSYSILTVGSALLIAGILAHSVRQGGVSFIIVMSYGSALTLVAAQFLSLRWAVLVATCYIGVSLLIFLLFAVDIPGMILARSVMFNVILNTIILIVTYFRQQRENERHQQLNTMTEELRHRTEMLNALVEFAPDGIGLLDRDGRVLLNNQAAELSNYRVAGRRLKEMPLSPTFVERFEAEFAEVLATKQPRTYHPPHLVESSTTDYELTLTPILDKAGEVSFVISTIRNITEQRQAEDVRVMLAVERDRTAFFSTFVEALSHDFRTSLTSVELNRYMIERISATDQESPLMARLVAIHNAVTHMQQQLDNLSIIAVLGRNPRMVISLREVIELFIDDYIEKARRQSITLETEHRQPEPTCLCDAIELQIALRHLIDNAITYSHEGGTVKVVTYTDDDFGCICVRDTGMGIPPEHLPHIFDLFYRGDTARPLRTGGVGLGLSIAKLVVEAHGGTISVDSRPGAGSAFLIRLPLHATA